MTRREALQAWLELLRAESHVLRWRPDLAFQQAANQPAGDPVGEAARHRLESGREGRPWLRWANRPPQDAVCCLTLTGHTARISACRFSPNGRRILSAGDRTLRAWDADSGEELWVWRGQAELTAADVAPDGTRILVGSFDGTLTVVDAASGDELFALDGHSKTVTDCCFSPDGRRALSAAADGTLRLWDAFGGRTLLTMAVEGWVAACAFSPDSERIASLHDAQGKWLTIREAAHGRVLNGPRVVGRDGRGAVSFSPDGTSVLTATATSTVLWDATTGEPRCTLEGRWDHVAFSPDGRWIASTGSVTAGMLVFNTEQMTLWETATGLAVGTLVGYRFGRCAFHPVGHRLLTGDDAGTLRVFATGEWRATAAARTESHRSEVTACAFAPDGRRIATAGGGELKLWAADSGQPQGSFQVYPDLIGCDFVADGRRVACASTRSSEVSFRDAETGSELAAGPGYYRAEVTAYALSPDGRRLAVGFKDGAVRVMDAARGKQLAQLDGHHGLPVSACTFSPDGERLLTASWDRTLRLWDAGRGRELLALEEEGLVARVMCCAFSPNGRLIAAGVEGHAAGLKVWDASSGRLLTALACREVSRCAFFADGRHVVAAARPAIVVYDVERGIVVNTMAARGAAPPLAASPDHRRIALRSAAGVEVLERSVDGQRARCFPGVYPTSLSWSPDGRRLAVGTQEGELCILSPQ